jgi:hypothetical protein
MDIALWEGNRDALSIEAQLDLAHEVPVDVPRDYYAVRPDDLSAPRGGIDIQIVPVIGEVF